MSTALAAPLRRPPSPLRPQGPALPSRAPHIEIVPVRAQRRARPRAVYAGVVVGSLGALMTGQLLLSIAVSDGAYTIDRLQTEQKAQARTVQQLTEDLGRLSSPQFLAQNAEALGMVPNANPVWLRMSDGAVIGAPAPARAGTGVLAAGSLVANDLLAGVPLVTELGTPASGGDAAPGVVTGPQVASQGQPPAPTTR
ncbi:MAG: hypothetical protein JWP66_1119 [Naasia sp.]|nr:hypothetical protein [Naasia sp.]